MLETTNAMYVIKFVELLCSRSSSSVQVANQKFRAADVTNEGTNGHLELVDQTAISMTTYVQLH